MRGFWHIIIFCFAFGFAQGQRKNLDSLLKAISKSSNDTNKVILIDIVACGYRDISDYEKAISYLQQGLELSEKLKYKRGFGMCYNTLGLIYEYTGDYGLAIENDLKALSIYDALNDKQQASSLLNNIGNIYLHQRNLEKAEEYYLKASTMNVNRQTPFILANLGLIYTYMGEKDSSYFSKALEYYKMALSLHNTNGNKRGIGDVYINMGLIHYDQKNFKKALTLHQKALEIFMEYKDKRRMNIAYENMANDYSMLGDLEKAYENIDIGLKLAKEIGDKEGIQSCYLSLFEILYKKGNYEEAYRSHLEYARVTDTLLNEESNKQIAEMNTKYESEKKDKEILKKDAEITKQESVSKQQSIIIISAIVGIILASIMGLLVLRSYREKRRANIEISEQKSEIELKNKEILDSIHYAKRIQGALLAGDKLLNDNLKEHFVLYKPKDIVSGDFYWAHKIDSKFLVCTADCTGHGVPGAFMSLLNISFLNEVTTEKKITQPDKVLNHVRDSIIITLNAEGNEESKDGMDCIFCSIDEKNKKLEYAAANNSFYIIRKGELLLQQADKMPVGKSPRDKETFILRTVDLHEGDVIYTLTDGYADQFGGPKGKKFKYKALEEILLAIHHLPMPTQQQKLNDTIERWKGSLEQVDDILIIGIRV